jgi:AcrR family transcriptional regulator
MARSIDVCQFTTRRPPATRTRQRILAAALQLISARGGADVTMAEVARKARVSRQALYLHFADRAELFTAAVRDADEQRGLPAAIREVVDAPTGIDGVIEMVALQARMNPGIWPIARAFEAVRRQDEAAERTWQDRLDHRLEACRAMVDRLAREGTLRPGLDRDVAADLLWTLTSLRMWEDLVLQRKWSAREYERRLGEVLLTTLTNTAASILQRR